VLVGDDGDDILSGRLGDDTLSGGDGVDRASYLLATGPVTVSLTTNVANGADGTDSLSSIEDVVGGAFGDTLTGDGNVNRLEGSDGNDLLRGGLGDDTLDGGFGSDTASWWLASGGVTVHLALGTATGAAGTDRLLSVENAAGSDGYADTLTGGAEANRLEGWGGDDLLRGGCRDRHD
jgi:Ca2+-binding RTX toxin-like protein